MTTANELVFKQDGEVLTGDDLMSNQSFLLNQQIVTNLNFLIEHSTFTYSPDDFFYDMFTGVSKVNTGTTTAVVCYNSTYGGTVYFCTEFDDFSSIDATKWTNSGCTVSAKHLVVGGSSSYISNGASGLDLKTFTGNSEVAFDIQSSHSGGGTRGTFKCQMSNGSTHVDLASFQAANDTTYFNRVQLLINKSGQTVDVFEDGVLYADDVDISSVTTNWYLRFVTTQTDGTTTGWVHPIGYLDGNAGSSIFQSTAQTIGQTSDAGIVKLQYIDSLSVPTTVALSADGSNFSTVGDGTMGSIANSGTSFILKCSDTHETTISATTPQIKGFIAYGSYMG